MTIINTRQLNKLELFKDLLSNNKYIYIDLGHNNMCSD